MTLKFTRIKSHPSEACIVDRVLQINANTMKLNKNDCIPIQERCEQKSENIRNTHCKHKALRQLGMSHDTKLIYIFN